jgi:hypothetical protein
MKRTKKTVVGEWTWTTRRRPFHSVPSAEAHPFYSENYSPLRVSKRAKVRKEQTFSSLIPYSLVIAHTHPLARGVEAIEKFRKTRGRH